MRNLRIFTAKRIKRTRRAKFWRYSPKRRSWTSGRNFDIKPILLTFKGINCYADAQSIDFTRLLDVGVFGVFGPTGGGKSTVLDAITLALYGKMPRFGKKLQASFINTYCDKADVYLKFDTSDGVYSVRRAYKKNDGSYKTVSVKLCKIDKNGEEIPVEDKESYVDGKTEQLVGLSYDDFTRSVALPQGKFSEFLLFGESERLKMAERVFGLERFGERLSAKVKRMKQETDNDVNAHANALSLLGDLSAEKVSSLRAKERDLRAELNDCERLYAEARANAEKYKRLTDIVREAAVASAKAESAEKELSSSALRAESAKQAAESAKQAADAAEALKERALSAVSADEEKLRQAREIERELSQSASYLARLLAEHVENDKLLKTKEAGLAGVNSRLSTIDAAFAAFASEKAEINVFLSNRHIIAEGLALSEKISNYVNEKNKLLKKIKNSENIINKNEIEKRGIDAEIERLTAETHALAADVKELAARQRAETAGFLRSSLSVGDECPVCGAVITDLSRFNGEKTRNAPIDGDLAEKENALNALTEHMREKTVAAQKAAFNAERERQIVEELTAELAQNSALYKETAELAARLSAKLGDDSADFAELNKKMARFDERRAEMDKSENAYALERVSLNKEKDAQNAEINDIRAVLQQTRLKGENARAIEKSAKERMFALLGGASPQAFEDETQKRRKTAVEASIAARDFFALKDDEQRRAETALTTAAALAAHTKQARDELEQRLNAQLEQENEKRGEIEEKAAFAENAQTSARERIDEINKNIGAILSELHKIAEDQAKAKVLSAKLSSAKSRAERLGELTRLLRGSAFLAFIAARRLRYVAYDASRRLKKMSGGRYALEPDGAGFAVRDDFAGGARRPPQTLSGGELFIASLAAALALSDMIQAQSGAKLGFFFLDEGFGSLDPDCLNTVMNALDALSRENMSIGVISHVEGLKERVLTRVNVVTDGGRSRIVTD